MVADCRMVESRWNDQTRHREAKVIREVFSNALRNSPRYEKDTSAYHVAKGIWIGNWFTVRDPGVARGGQFVAPE
jgi:hypothetical protein